MFPVSHPLDCTCVACKEQDRLDKLRAECAHDFGNMCEATFLGCVRTCVKCGQKQGLGRDCWKATQRQGEPHE